MTPEGINFAVFSHNGTGVRLELFNEADQAEPSASLRLDPRRHRTGDIWHLFVHGLPPGQLYGYRVEGPYAPELGHRFNPNKLLFDPYARAFAGRFDTEHDALYGHHRADGTEALRFNEIDSAAHTVRSVALADAPFDWEDARPPRHPLEQSVIYEAHVRGLTIHPSSAVAAPGTYLGLVEKIPHLLELGVTAVELMPTHEFDPHEHNGLDHVTGEPLGNYWGYSPLGFFAPQRRYASSPAPQVVASEFRQMVRALHQAGLEVILDVVFNHTGEGDERGPTIGFRGLDNAVYYMLDGGQRYRNYSGCGNTLNCNHPVVKQLIIDCLRHWVVEMHIDGFRFDLATILGRDRRGQWIGDDLGLLYDIGGDPILRGCKLIAESWDAEGMYKVGGFPAGWAEWNGRFRDDVRRFVRGDRGVIPDLARRIGGSRDLFGGKRTPARSINFVTAHDGFTLRDLVSYDSKHNERNGEDNRDGSDANYSSNYGVEGDTEDTAVAALRLRQAKNLLTVLLVSRGTPMFLGGDELWRTQQGNNNSYCQDNALSWFDWGEDSVSQDLLRFCRRLLALRRAHPALTRPCFVDPFASDGARAASSTSSEFRWHGVALGKPDWSYHSHSLALQIQGRAPSAAPGSDDVDFYIAFNAWSKPLTFALPDLHGPRWHRVIDTSRPSPRDIVDEASAPPVTATEYEVAPRSTLLLLGR